MKRSMIVVAMLCLISGCMRPMLWRLDEMNAQLTETNQKLTEMGEKIDVANEKLGTFEKAARLIVPGLDKKK